MLLITLEKMTSLDLTLTANVIVVVTLLELDKRVQVLTENHVIGIFLESQLACNQCRFEKAE